MDLSMKLNSHIYMLGIGGIGMSALAKYLLSRGYKVAGYDRVFSPITDSLVALGAQISIDSSVDQIPLEFKKRGSVTVVYTPAISKTQSLYSFFEESSFPLIKRSELLEHITQNSETWAVAGTHGKTTTSSILSHLAVELKVQPSAFLGGIPINYATNYIQGESNVCIVEADEFDRSSHRLYPHSAIITSMEPDHLDIYGTAEEFEEAFHQFSRQVSHTLIYNFGLPLKGISYGLKEGDHHIENLRIEDSNYFFDWIGPGFRQAVFMTYPGLHNIENAIAAAALCFSKGFDPKSIASAISTFKGVKRRFEYHIRSEKAVYIDDYAHHPGELKVLIESIRSLYPNRKLTLVFQPHLFSRTRDFIDGFASVLSLCDSLWLMPIYPAREEPIEGINSEALLERIICKEKRMVSASEIPFLIQKERPELLVSAGAGDIDRSIEPIKQAIELCC